MALPLDLIWAAVSLLLLLEFLTCWLTVVVNPQLHFLKSHFVEYVDLAFSFQLAD